MTDLPPDPTRPTPPDAAVERNADAWGVLDAKGYVSCVTQLLREAEQDALECRENWPEDNPHVVVPLYRRPAGDAEAAEREYSAHYKLAMLALQSERYATDPEYRDAVDDVLGSFGIGKKVGAAGVVPPED